jgi:hypothetical protein
MNISDTINILEELEIMSVEFVIYGKDDKYIESAIPIVDAIEEIKSMSENEWNNQNVFPCDEHGNIY